MKKMMLWGMLLLSVMTIAAQDVKTPLSELKDMAAGPNGKAQLVMARHFVDGDSVPQNYYMAMHWLGQAWRNGEGKGIKKTLMSMAKAKNKGKYHGFLRFVEGTAVMNIHQDYRQSMKLLTDGYLNGNQEDDCFLQQGVLTQIASPEDSVSLNITNEEKEAMKERLLLTSSTVQTAAGIGFLESKRDTAQAISLLDVAAESGFVLAHETLGVFYLLSKAPYYNATKAVYHLQQAERGHQYRSCEWLAYCYEHELAGLKHDAHRIEELKEKSSDTTDYVYFLMSWLTSEKWFAKRLYEI